MTSATIRQELLAILPPIVVRASIAEYLGKKTLSPRYLANLDCKKQGPKNKMTIGNKAAYPREDFVDWYVERIRFA